MRAAGLCFLATLSVAGCVSDAPPPVAQSFSALHYDYLPKLRLNVATIEVIDRSLPVAPQDVASSSPAVPAQALAQMARDRLFATGSVGTANFTIDQASIVRVPSGEIDGQLAVHLDIIGPDGRPAGFAEARVARQHIPGSEPEDGSANLYALTQQMMDAMNVELEFQIRRSLRSFMVSDAAVPTPVTAQPLGMPGAPLVPPPPPALPPAVHDAPQPVPEAEPAPSAQPDGYQDPAGLSTAPPQPQTMSPPPTTLQLPSGS